MLTIASFVMDQAAPGPAWLWHPPSVFTMADIFITIALGIYFVAQLRKYKRARNTAAEEDVVTPRQHERLVGRLDAFEHAQKEGFQRIDALSHQMMDSEKRREADWIMLRDTSEKQLEVLRALKSVNERGNAKVNYVANAVDEVRETLHSRPCLFPSASAECPAGFDGDKE